LSILGVARGLGDLAVSIGTTFADLEELFNDEAVKVAIATDPNLALMMNEAMGDVKTLETDIQEAVSGTWWQKIVVFIKGSQDVSRFQKFLAHVFASPAIAEAVKANPILAPKFAKLSQDFRSDENAVTEILKK
jgi:hypothetical protein